MILLAYKLYASHQVNPKTCAMTYLCVWISKESEPGAVSHRLSVIKEGLIQLRAVENSWELVRCNTCTIWAWGNMLMASANRMCLVSFCRWIRCFPKEWHSSSFFGNCCQHPVNLNEMTLLIIWLTWLNAWYFNQTMYIVVCYMQITLLHVGIHFQESFNGRHSGFATE